MNFKHSALSRRKFLNTGSLALTALLSSQTRVVGATGNAGYRAIPAAIPTVTGSIMPEDIGVTLMHEHLLFFNGVAPDDPGFQSIPNDLRDDSVDFVSQLLSDAARVGINTIVDVGPHRPIDLYKQIAERTKINLIVSTGFYRQSKLPPWLANMNDQRAMEEYMKKELTEGIEDTGIRAGIIKIAQQHRPMSDWEQKAFRAAATVQKETGVHMATHTGNAIEQFDLLVKSGANPSHLYFSHVDVNRKGKVGDLLKLLKAGCYLEVDTFGQTFYTPESLLVSFIRSVCDAGYSKQLFISIDSNWHWVNGEKKFEGSEPPHLDATASNRTFAYMITDAVPMLLKSGFSINDIRAFLIDNPRRYFSGKATI